MSDKDPTAVRLEVVTPLLQSLLVASSPDEAIEISDQLRVLAIQDSSRRDIHIVAEEAYDCLLFILHKHDTLDISKLPTSYQWAVAGILALWAGLLSEMPKDMAFATAILSTKYKNASPQFAWMIGMLSEYFGYDVKAFIEEQISE